MNEPANEVSNIGPLSEEDIRGMQILNFCFMAGMVGFLGVIVFLFIISTEPKAPGAQGSDPDLFQNLSIANAAVFISCFIAGSLIFKSKVAGITKAYCEADQESTAPAPGLRWLAGSFKGAFVLRLSMLEGPGLFGGVICLLSINLDVIHHHPIHWLNLLSLIASVTYMAIAFPTQAKLTRLFSLEEQSLYR